MQFTCCYNQIVFSLEFVIYVVFSIITITFLICVLVPKYGKTNVLIYILIVAILGSYTVMSLKGIALGIREINEKNSFLSYSYTCFFVVSAASCIVTQINYLNKALDVFNTAIVTTINYVLFSFFVMLASSLLFDELLNVSLKDFIGMYKLDSINFNVLQYSLNFLKALCVGF